jgi:NhaP-type Na+/H+ or K+/H+ antiporter
VRRHELDWVSLIAGLVCLYAIGKASHLSPLVLVLVVGLLFNNPHLLEWNARLKAMHTADYDRTLKEFKGLVAELTFATKSLFFLLLGYWTDVQTMLSVRAWLIAAAGVALIVASRWLILRALRQPAAGALVWIAPRGLITVLLFLTAAEAGALASFPFGTVMLVVLVTATLTTLAHRGRAVPSAPATPTPAATDPDAASGSLAIAALELPPPTTPSPPRP